jgi:urease subunit alpha
VVAIKDTRGLSKADMPLNDAQPDIRVEPDTFRVWVDGEEIVPAPAAELPLAQRYELF